MVTQSLFSLRDIDVYDRSFGHLDELPTLSTTFSLPELTENVSSSERILASLNTPYPNYGPRSPSRKGKEREVRLEDVVQSTDVQPAAARSSLWDDFLDTGIAGPSSGRSFKPMTSWDAKEEAETRKAHMMSQVPSLFEALAFHDECLPVPPIPQAAAHNEPRDILSLLLACTLGTMTTKDLAWDKKRMKFRWSGKRVEGVEVVSFESFIEVFLDIATAIRRLETIIDTHSTSPLTPTHHALLHATTTYLTHLKQQLADIIEENSSVQSTRMHEAASSLRSLRELASLLCDIMCWPLVALTPEGLPARASSLLTHLYSFLQAHHVLSLDPTPSALATAYLLSMTSGPFLELLHGWLGLLACSADEDLDPSSQPWVDLGITRTPLPLAENGDLRWSFEFSAKKMPGFIPRSLRRTLFEAGRSLRLLREASGNHHPLCSTDWDLQTGWGWVENQTSSSSGTIRAHVRRIRKDVESWRRSALDKSRLQKSTSLIRLGHPKKERKRLPIGFMDPTTPLALSTSHPSAEDVSEVAGSPSAGSHFTFDPLWTMFSLAPGAHLEENPSPIWTPSPLDTLQAFLQYHSKPSSSLTPSDAPSLEIYLSEHLLAPLLAHAKMVSTSLVSLFLDDLNLLDHYDILRSFFLGGDIGFFERVSAALFGKDEAGAGEALGLGKRARTRARLGLGGGEIAKEEGVWGIGLGLGLSERARWPPGGAELAYALRTTFVDDDEIRVGVWEGIEDKIGFGVKSLPEDEKDGQRARWMDPQAIEALDFLYLSYSAPTFVCPLLPTAILDKYQRVNNLLLRVCRIKTVARSLYLDTVHQTPLFEEPVKQGIDSGSRPVSRASNQDRQIQELFPPRSKVDFTLHRLRFRMSTFAVTLERYLLDVAIGSNWDVMRKKLEKLKTRIPGSDTPVPSTPVDRETAETFERIDVPGDDDDSDDGGSSTGLVQLNSIDSLVSYHHLILNRILRASLLAPSAGHQVTFKVLMGLFGCILDLGKTIKEVERGSIGWQVGAERVDRFAKDWQEREMVLLHALERLSQRGSKERDHQEGDEKDLEILLHRDEGDDEDVSADGGNLGELLIRLRMGQSVFTEGRGGKKGRQG